MLSPIKLEEPSSDSEDQIFALPESLVPSPEHTKPHISTTDFDGLLSTPLQLKVDLAEGCGGALWPAGMVLAKYLLRIYGNNPELLSGKKILELGAGSGLVGLALALLRLPTPPLIIQLTDLPTMLPLIQTNISLNSLSNLCTASVLSWGSSLPSELHAEIILAADCVYFEPAFPLLQETLKQLIEENTVCWFCFKRRRRADMLFMKKAKKMFCVEEVADDPDMGVYSRENIHLYKITKKK